jgi:hypothetical protein
VVRAEVPVQTEDSATTSRGKNFGWRKVGEAPGDEIEI